MAHVFDTGLPKPQRTLVIQGALTLLAGLKKTNGLYLHAVIDWGGVIRSFQDDEGIDELFEAFQGRAPAVALALGDRVPGGGGMGGHKHLDELELLVYFLTRHPRGLEAGRQVIDAAAAADNTLDPGLHVMLEHVEELLVGTRVGSTATIKQIRLTREVEVRTRNGYSLWCQHYGVSVDRQVKEFRNVTEYLDHIRTTLHLGDTTVPAPNDPTIVIDNTATPPPP